jgi:hypothetical protein
MATLAALALPSAWSRSAAAFCRSTTCSPERPCDLDEDGCEIGGLPLTWPVSCVGVSLQRDGTERLPIEEVSRALDASLSTWSSVPCLDDGNASIALGRLKPVGCARTEYDPNGPNANSVIFRDATWSYAASDQTLAFTTVTFDVATGLILDADVEINSLDNEITGGEQPVAYDLESILTHELGHLLGLAHSPDPIATMNPSYEPGTTSQRDLETDDVGAICAAYPPGRKASCDVTPRGGFSSVCLATREPAGATSPAEGCAVHGVSVWKNRPGASSLPPGIGACSLALAAAARLARRRVARRCRPGAAPGAPGRPSRRPPGGR